MLSLRSAPGPKPSSPGQGAGAFSESSTEVKERLFFEIFALASFPGSQLSKVGLGPPLGRRGLSPLKPAGPQFVPGQTSYSGQLGQTCSRPRKTLLLGFSYCTGSSQAIDQASRAQVKNMWPSSRREASRSPRLLNSELKTKQKNESSPLTSGPAWLARQESAQALRPKLPCNKRYAGREPAAPSVTWSESHLLAGSPSTQMHG